MKIPDRKADTMAAAIVSMLSELPNELVKTIPATVAPSLPAGKLLKKD